MTPRLATFRAGDGYQFYYRHYPATGPARARVVFLHGIRSHGGWYQRSGAVLAAAGFDTYFLDRRGAGLNTAYRGDAPSFRRLLDDVAEFLQALRAEPGFLPVFLAGISWGGKLAAALPYRRPGLVDGLVLLCPGLVSRVRPGWTQRLCLAAARLFRPGRLFPIPLNEPELFTASPEGQRFIAADPWGLRRATTRFLMTSVALDVYLRRAVRAVTVPTLLLLAGRDRIVDNPRIRAVLAHCPGPVEVVEYPDAYHTLEFEPPDHPWQHDLIAWLTKHSG